MPIRNEKENIVQTLNILKSELKQIDYELVIINDFSTDSSLELVESQKKNYPQVSLFNNETKGLGGAIVLGIKKSRGNLICIMMSDLSDNINDLQKYYKLIQDENVDAIFGSRFISGSKINGYPKKKLILNRIFNFFTKLIFFSDYNDFTNAFKIYKKKAILETFPLVSESYNIFLEIPLKIISRKLKYKIIPISWENRKLGKSKFIIKGRNNKPVT